MREKVHHYKFCPECKANVEPHYRFCRSCFAWLSRPPREMGIRSLSIKPDTDPRDSNPRFWLELGIFQASYRTLATFITLFGICGFMIYLYSITVLPAWMQITPKMKRNACYATMRTIQTGIEQYCLERPFSPALASEPAKTLMESGYLRSIPTCPIPGNYYRIPKGFSLQCLGSEGHGLPIN